MKTCFLFLSALAFAVVGRAGAPVPAPGLQFSGFLQFRTEWTQNPRITAPEAGDTPVSELGPAGVDAKSETRTMLWLNVDNQFDGHTRFHALVNAEGLGGRTVDNYLQLWEAFVEAKAGPATVAVGRFLPDIGLGTLGGAPFMDGGHAALGNGFVKAQVYLVKFGFPGQAPDTNTADKSTYTYLLGDIKVTPVRGLTLAASYFGDTTTHDPAPNVIGGTLYHSWAVGAEYKYVKDQTLWWSLAAEFADNSAAMARKINGTTAPYALTDCTEGPDPKAYFVKAKVLGANPAQPGTFGFQVEYRKADAGFDVTGMANPSVWNAPFNWTCPATGGSADNHKGTEVSAEVTLLPRCLFKVSYGFMKLVNATSTIDLASPALAVVNSVTPTSAAPIIGMVNGAQNKVSQDYLTASVRYLF